MVDKLSIPVYLVSLEQDTARRESLEKNFPKYYPSFIHVEAVDGRELPAKEYYDATISFFHKHKRPMSPAELGCTLSHIKALEQFLSTDAPFALIIEDDIKGLDSDIDLLINNLGGVDSRSIVFVGCQEGLMNRYKYGYHVNENLLKAPKSSYGNFSRTAAYVVSREVAGFVLGYHKRKLITVADFWFELLKGCNASVYYFNKIEHPLDLSSSNIESVRAGFHSSFFKKVFDYKVVLNRIDKELKYFYYKLLGCKRIE